MQGRKKYLLLLVPIGLIILLFEILPLLSIIVSSFRDPMSGSLTLNNFIEVFTSEYYLMSVRNSLYVSTLSAVIGILISLIASYAIHTSSERLRSGFINVLNMTSNFQGLVLAFAFILLLGNSGVFTNIGEALGLGFLAEYNLYSTSGILITFVYFQIPLGTLLLYPSFDAILTEYKEAAAILNASNSQFWLRVGLPIVFPSVVGTFSVLFSNALAAYATPYALLGNNYALLPIRISSMFTGDVVQQVELGSALSIIMLILMGIVTLVCNLWVRQLRREG